jgi:hypothetical protein
MTLAKILAGPADRRTAGASHPMTEAEARGYIMRFETISDVGVRLLMVALCLLMCVHITPEARALLLAYADFCEGLP